VQFAIAGFNAECRANDTAAGRRVQPLIGRFLRIVDESESLENLALWRSGSVGFSGKPILSGAPQFAVSGKWRPISEGVDYGIEGCGGQRQ
jgi:hypothetical protein